LNDNKCGLKTIDRH